MLTERFILNHDECEVLIAFELHKTIEKTAQALSRDSSRVSRILACIHEKYPAIEKRGSKWVLTDTGRKLNAASKNYITEQKNLIGAHQDIRIGTNREFATRIISPQLSTLAEIFPNTRFTVFSFAEGTEKALLAGQIDYGIDCNRPENPEIAYQQCIAEPVSAFCTPEFYKRHKKQIQAQNLQELPHLLCERLHPDKYFLNSQNQFNIAAHFNDISAVRAACLTGFGWALLPAYSVKTEVCDGLLTPIGSALEVKTKYGVWWSRSRQKNSQVINSLITWLKKQSLVI